MFENFGKSGGEGGLILGANFGKSRGEGGSYGKSLPWGGGYGNFLEPHICMCFSGGDRVFVLDSLVMQETVFQCTVCTVEYSKFIQFCSIVCVVICRRQVVLLLASFGTHSM